ncbi:hypothetical protein GW17_00016495 [Ensete ventricosum]|nr:hypothetical protein GW17_00016495 [Ensete ventricosum]
MLRPGVTQEWVDEGELPRERTKNRRWRRPYDVLAEATRGEVVVRRQVFRVCASKLASDESLGHQHMGAVYHRERSQIASTSESHGGDLIIQRYDRSGWRVGLLQCSHSLKGARQVKGQNRAKSAKPVTSGRWRGHVRHTPPSPPPTRPLCRIHSADGSEANRKHCVLQLILVSDPDSTFSIHWMRATPADDCRGTTRRRGEQKNEPHRIPSNPAVATNRAMCASVTSHIVTIIMIAVTVIVGIIIPIHRGQIGDSRGESEQEEEDGWDNLGCRRRGRLARIEGLGLAGIRRSDDDEGAAAYPARHRMHHPETQRRRHGSVHRVAPRPQRRHPDLRAPPVVRRHHSHLRLHRLRPSDAPPPLPRHLQPHLPSSAEGPDEHKEEKPPRCEEQYELASTNPSQKAND